MTSPTLQALDVSGRRMQVAMQGRGPLVLVCRGFPELRKYRKMYPCKGTIQQLKQLRRLHQEFRNDFAHFVLKGWSTELAGLPAIIETALKLIEEAMKQDQVLMRLSGNGKRRLERNLVVTRTALGFTS